MNTLPTLLYFFAGLFAANAIPHFASGVMGRAFQTPFAKPPGRGLSSSTVNVLWGFFNAVVGYLLLEQAGALPRPALSHAVSFAVGVLLISMFAARHFGQFHGGNAPERS